MKHTSNGTETPRHWCATQRRNGPFQRLLTTTMSQLTIPGNFCTIESKNVGPLLGWISFHTGLDKKLDFQALKDGVILLHLIDKLTDHKESKELSPPFLSSENGAYLQWFADSKKTTIKTQALTRFQQLSNLTVLMNWLNSSQLSPFYRTSSNSIGHDIIINGVSALDMAESSSMKPFEGLLWTLFWNFIIFEPAEKSHNNNMKNIQNKQEILLRWISSKTEDTTISFDPQLWFDTLFTKLAKSLSIITDDSSAAPIFDIMEKTYHIPKFISAENEKVDELSIFIYLSCWFDLFKETTETKQSAGETVEDKSESEFSDFFGPNILSKASAISDYHFNMPLKLKVETFLVIAVEINDVKNKFLKNSEKLLLEIVDLIGLFAEFDSFDYSNDSNKPVDLEKLNLEDPLSTLEQQLEEEAEGQNTGVKEEAEDETPVEQAIKMVSFITNFRKSTKRRISEQFFELKLHKVKLNDILHSYGFDKFVEPSEKSIVKIAKFIKLLENSENSIYSNSIEFIDQKIANLKHLIDLNEQELKKRFEKVEYDLLKIGDIDSIETRLVELEHVRTTDLMNLKKLYLNSVQYKNQLELINSSLNYGVNKDHYKLLVNNQRSKLGFIGDCIENSVAFLNKLKNQKWEANEVLNIAKMSEKYQGELEPSENSELKVHLFVHKLIQRTFHFKNIDPTRVLFEKNDIGSKNYLTKSEFKKAFLVAYPNTIKLAGVDEIDTIFETSYEAVGKVRRGIEFPQFKAIIELGNNSDINIDEIVKESQSTHTAEDNETVDSNSSTLNKLISQFDSLDVDSNINLTSDLFLQAFNELSTDTSRLSADDLSKIKLHRTLLARINEIFPNGKYHGWFENNNQSCIYQDQTEDEMAIMEDGNVNYTTDIETTGLKNVLYELEKVDLSKI